RKAPNLQLCTRLLERQPPWTPKFLNPAMKTISDEAVPASLRNLISDPETPVPYLTTIESQRHFGLFGKYYVCKGIDGERWLVEKDIFEKTYEEVK
ncbi:MAG: hypothetical protein MUE99_11750, partial [Chitinophagaceae bacterium]|nr:hypothetical protein [Chitinophagaceae bacterium]